MDFWRTVMVLLRRWYITVPAFFVTLGIAGAAYSIVPVQYQSGSVLVLTTPLTGGTEATHAKSPNSLTNPLLNFDRSLALTASIVIQQMNSPETAVSLGITPGGTTSYQITNGSTNPELLESGPFLFVEGTGPSPGAAQDIAERASAMAADALDRRQSELNAPTSTHITIQVVVPPTTGQPLKGSPMRAAAAAGALAGLVSLIAVYGFESLMTHRRRRRVEKERSVEDPRPASTPAADLREGGVGPEAGGTNRRSKGPEAPEATRRVQQVAAVSADHQGDGAAAPATAASAVRVLESPAGVGDNADGVAADSRRRRTWRRKRGSSRGRPGDRPAHGPSTEER
jgi:hypothetical protein